MQIKYHRVFTKRFKKLPKKLQVKTHEIIEKFTKDPYDKSLRNHPLKGSQQGKRAFSITGDMRIIFEEYENYTLVLILDIGTHNQVY